MQSEQPKDSVAKSEIRSAPDAAPNTSVAHVRVGGELIASPRPEQPTYSLTDLEFDIIRKGSNQSDDHNLGYACVGIFAGMVTSIVGLLFSVSFVSAGQTNWWALGSIALFSALLLASGGIGAHCFIRARKARGDDVYQKVLNRIDCTVNPKPPPAPPTASKPTAQPQ